MRVDAQVPRPGLPSSLVHGAPSPCQASTTLLLLPTARLPAPLLLSRSRRLILSACWSRPPRPRVPAAAIELDDGCLTWQPGRHTVRGGRAVHSPGKECHHHLQRQGPLSPQCLNWLLPHPARPPPRALAACLAAGALRAHAVRMLTAMRRSGAGRLAAGWQRRLTHELMLVAVLLCFTHGGSLRASTSIRTWATCAALFRGRAWWRWARPKTGRSTRCNPRRHQTDQPTTRACSRKAPRANSLSRAPSNTSGEY